MDTEVDQFSSKPVSRARADILVESDTIRDRRRFAELVDWVAAAHYLAWAYYLGHKGDSKIRGWMKGINLPHDYLKLVAVFGGDPPKLQSLSDAEWQQYLMTLAGAVLPKLASPPSPGMVRTAEVFQTLQKAAMDSAIIWAINQQDHNWIGEMKTCVRMNAASRVNNVIILQKHSPSESNLRRLMDSTRGLAGSTHIVIDDSDDILWRRDRAIVLVTRPGVTISKVAVEQMEAEDITQGFAMAYKPGDSIPAKNLTPTSRLPLWFGLPHPDLIDLAFATVQKWLLKGEWVPRHRETAPEDQ